MKKQTTVEMIPMQNAPKTTFVKKKREVLHNENPHAFLVPKIKFVCYFLCLFTIRFSPFIM